MCTRHLMYDDADCYDIAGQLILKSSEVLKSPPLKERGKETHSKHSKSHKGENHKYTLEQIEKMRKIA